MTVYNNYSLSCLTRFGFYSIKYFKHFGYSKVLISERIPLNRKKKGPSFTTGRQHLTDQIQNSPLCENASECICVYGWRVSRPLNVKDNLQQPLIN